MLEDKNHLLLRRSKKKKMWNNPVFLYFTIWENSKIDIDLIARKDFYRANLAMQKHIIRALNSDPKGARLL
jgi:hypothetical protein